MYSNIQVHIRRILELTEQQFKILVAIAQANKEHAETSPSAIQKVYTKITKKPIQKSNLFPQLKHLTEIGAINKFGKANYTVNKDKLKELMLRKKEEFIKESELCDAATEEID